MTHPDEAVLRCRRATRCGNARTHPTTNPDGTTSRNPTPDWATTPGGLCRTDTQLTLRAIEQLPRDHYELGLLLGKTSRTLDAPTGGTRDLPTPLRLGILAVQEAITEAVDLWAEAVAEKTGTPWHAQNERTARAVRAGRALPAGRDLLTEHHDVLLALPPIEHLAWVPAEARVQLARCTGGHWNTHGGPCTDLHVREVWRDDNREWMSTDGVDAALLLLDLHERVERVEGRMRRAHRLWSPCPRCQTLALQREEGAGNVDCRRCGHRMTLEEYEKIADILTQAYDGKKVAA